MILWLCGIVATASPVFAALPASDELAPALSGAPLKESQALTLKEVLERVDRHAPELIAAQAKLDAAEAKVLEARGSFDPKLKAGLKAAPLGYYQNLGADAAIGVATAYGPEVLVGWRIGNGKYADYDGAQQTLDGGELRLGVSLPLLRDLGINPDRAKLIVQQKLVDGASASLDEKSLQVRLKATGAWLKWVAAGQKRALAARQLGLATDRQEALERRVATGALPRIESVDNQTVVLEREGSLREAELDEQVAALILGLYSRDEAGQPLTPGPDELPEALSSAAPLPVDLDQDLERAQDQRPELVAMRALVEAARTDRALARSRLLPDVGLDAGLSQDFGQGSETKAQTELKLGITVESSLLVRKERGQISRAEAALAELEAELRWREDQVAVAVRGSRATVEQAWARYEIAGKAVESAQEVQRLERRAFELGASDIFRLNRREDTTNKLTKAQIEAQVAYELAQSEYRAAVGLK